MKYVTTVNGTEFQIEIRHDGKVLVNNEEREIDFLPFSDSALFSLIMDNVSHEVLVEEREGHFEVMMRGRLFTAEVLDERARLLAKHGSSLEVDTGEISIKAPMPGLVVAVPVSEGDEVSAGQTVIILESMKMQNELKAPRDGVVQRISVTAGQSVDQNTVLVTLV